MSVMKRWTGTAALIAAVLILVACGSRTPVAATQPATPGAGYPAPATPEPATPAGGYPAPVDTPVPPTPASGYPAQAETAVTAAPATEQPPTTAPGTPATVEIVYRNFEIVPASTTIKVGTTVTFLIKDGLHQPYNFTPPNKFEAPPNLGDGATFTYTFAEAGTTTILCGYHKNMQAVVIVEP